MEQETKKKLLRPSCDVVFQALFQENKENITQSLISDILGKRVEIIDIKAESTIARKYPTDKSGRLDLKTKFKDGTICQIEMQMAGDSNIVKRILYYWAKTYSKQLKSGGKYQELKKTIGILISNFEIKELEEIEELNTKWQIIETKKGKKVLTEDLELHIIEIPKAKRVLAKEANNRIAQWLVFLDNPNTERVEEIMEKNEDVKKAKEVLSQMSEDEELQMLAELREKWDLDERSALASARDEGIEEGRQEGKQEGERNKSIEIATNMLKEGTSVEFIQKVTGLAKEEIEKLS